MIQWVTPVEPLWVAVLPDPSTQRQCASGTAEEAGEFLDLAESRIERGLDVYRVHAIGADEREERDGEIDLHYLTSDSVFPASMIVVFTTPDAAKRAARAAWNGWANRAAERLSELESGPESGSV
jgi:hypothetical protein